MTGRVAARPRPNYTYNYAIVLLVGMVTAGIIGIVIGLAAAAASTWGLIMMRRINRRLNAALGGSEPVSLEASLTAHMKQVDIVDRRLAELESEYARLSVTGGLASQKIAIVRFNPFGDTGGDQSFSLAVLDAHNSGYVLTSIHGREGTRVYVKPVDFGRSKYTFSSEEKQALALAEKRVPQTT